MFAYAVIQSTGQKFYLKGSRPEILITSGIHGDEYEIVPLVEEMVTRYEKELPDFLYVPAVSPSAIANRSHLDAVGRNVNREFFSETQSPEAQEMMNLWSRHHFRLYATFHEDPDRANEFYIYDEMKPECRAELGLEGSPRFESLKKDILALGVELYNGPDDPSDPALGYQVKDGYVYLPMVRNDRTPDYWLLVENDNARHAINPEIPGRAPAVKKRAIVEAIFRRLLLNQA